MSQSPYLTTGPTLLSFSGGRTSAYMLHETIQAHGGTLPDHVVVAFANTGKEREETLRFVYECGSRWGVRIRWLEWRQEAAPCFVEVDFNSASRNGEPFDALIASKQAVPNSFMRFCTADLKVNVMRAFTRSLGWSHCVNTVGLRGDEGKRVARQLNRPDDLWSVRCPLYDANKNRTDIMEFWSRHDFDLGLHPWEGNCDCCFLKGERILDRIIRSNPTLLPWWINHEKNVGHQFKKGRASYSKMLNRAHTTPMLPLLDPDEEYDVECGLSCGAEA